MAARSRGAWWAVAALVLATLTGGFDITVLNVALPTIGSQLGAGTTALQWMVNAYVLVFACLILPMGAAGDRWGRRQLLMGGPFLFDEVTATAMATRTYRTLFDHPQHDRFTAEDFLDALVE